jgi:hypothetical protein
MAPAPRSPSLSIHQCNRPDPLRAGHGQASPVRCRCRTHYTKRTKHSQALRAQLESYSDALYRAPLSIDWRQLNLAGRGNRRRAPDTRDFWVAGNGGSADIADHLLLQLGQRHVHPSQAPILVHSLTACANASPRREGRAKYIGGAAPSKFHGLEDNHSRRVRWQ